MSVFTSFEIFLTNLGKYNEGELVGEWLRLPVSREELSQSFSRIGIGSVNELGHCYEEWFITDYECPFSGLYELLGEYEDLNRLNYFAALLEGLPEADRKKLGAIMGSGCHSVHSLNELIQLILNLDCYELLEDIREESDLGYLYLQEHRTCSSCGNCPMASYIDCESLGRDLALDEDGYFTEDGYVRRLDHSPFSSLGDSSPEIPEEYRIIGQGAS